MADGVFMDVPAVRGFAKNFKNFSQILQGVAKALDALALTLKMTAFVGLVGGAFYAQALEALKPHIDKLAAKCQEIGEDLDLSATAFERGDQLGATRFH